MTATHEMLLEEDHFTKSQSGQRSIDIRLCDEKKSLINVGDEIVFTCKQNQDLKFKGKVIELLKYLSFEKLLNENSIADCGFDDRDGVLDFLYGIYPPEKETEFGVLGIRFEVIAE